MSSLHKHDCVTCSPALRPDLGVSDFVAPQRLPTTTKTTCHIKVIIVTANVTTLRTTTAHNPNLAAYLHEPRHTPP